MTFFYTEPDAKVIILDPSSNKFGLGGDCDCCVTVIYIFQGSVSIWLIEQNHKH